VAELEVADAQNSKHTRREPCQCLGHAPRAFDLRRELYSIFLLDLMDLPGIVCERIRSPGKREPLRQLPQSGWQACQFK
jgi:hypothetical protein